MFLVSLPVRECGLKFPGLDAAVLPGSRKEKSRKNVKRNNSAPPCFSNGSREYNSDLAIYKKHKGHFPVYIPDQLQAMIQCPKAPNQMR